MPQDPDGSRSICGIQTCKEFVEVGRGLHPYRCGHLCQARSTHPLPPGHFLSSQLTGDAGDVILLHPFMVCAAQTRRRLHLRPSPVALTPQRSPTPRPRTTSASRDSSRTPPSRSKRRSTSAAPTQLTTCVPFSPLFVLPHTYTLVPPLPLCPSRPPVLPSRCSWSEGKEGDHIHSRGTESHFGLRAPQSLVEAKILRALGVPALPEWTIAAPRRRFTPRTRAGKDAMIREEVQRMKAHARATGGTVDSMHLDGPVPYQVVVASG